MPLRGSPENPAGDGDGSKVVTITDVARRARVGESTVSRVLRNKGSYSRQTREKVLKAAADLNYVPNRIAGTLATMTSKLIGIVIPSVGNTVVPEVLAGANSVLEGAGFQPVIGVSNYDPKREEELIESILSWRPAGILLAGLEHTDRARALLKGSGVRVVVENWFDLLPAPKEMNWLLDGLKGKIGLNGDLGNWAAPAKYAGLADIMGRAELCHAKADYNASGLDSEDYGKCLEASRSADYAGPFTLIYDSPFFADEWDGILLQKAFIEDFLDTRQRAIA